MGSITKSITRRSAPVFAATSHEPDADEPRINMAHVAGSGTAEIVVADSVNVPPRGFPAEHDSSMQSVGKILPASVPV